ncbi:TetR/AcrR family transcriptional regulator [Streptomyces niveiscabiei]|uniref:TetR/AcrR family transcriptional regulator n=1 Tax=Streptomyces niveiscabiei TaxID=164115 RepID=A0ABW9I1V9_9ACTN
MTKDSGQRRTPQVVLTDAEILRRGLDAFAELGYRGASVRELAKRLGVSHNFFNERFGSKEEFWRAVVDAAGLEPSTELAATLSVDMDDAEKFGAVVRTFYANAGRAPQLNQIVAEESALDSERLDHLYAALMAPFLAQVEPLAQRLMSAGRMPVIPLDILFSALTGPALVLTQEQLARRLGRAPHLTPTEWDARTRSLADVVLHGLLPTT